MQIAGTRFCDFPDDQCGVQRRPWCVYQRDPLIAKQAVQDFVAAMVGMPIASVNSGAKASIQCPRGGCFFPNLGEAVACEQAFVFRPTSTALSRMNQERMNTAQTVNLFLLAVNKAIAPASRKKSRTSATMMDESSS